jgi:hypothetical protein
MNLLAKFKDPNTNWKYILIVVMVAFAVGVGIVGYQWWIGKEEVKAPEKVSKNETADWKTYRNEEYGYAIRYPNNYVLKEETMVTTLEEESPPAYKYSIPVQLLSRVEISFPSFPPEGAKIEINIYNNADNLTLNQWFDYLENPPDGLEPFRVGDKEPILVAGIESIKGVYGCCGECIKGVFIPNENKIYNLGLKGYAGYFPDYAGYYGYSKKDSCYLGDESIFNRMLSTFRFLGQF